MKLAKMSMVAALLLGANVYAIDNVKVNGDASLYYHTDDSETAAVGGQGGFFDQDSSAAQAALRLGITADLTEGVSAGATMTALSTLGLEGNLVSNVWEAGAGAGVTSDYWFSEAWIAATAGKTTAKLGRQTLDTPLVFTETWSIAPNTFESVVLINQDIADTTLVGAFVGTSSSGAGAGSTQVGGGISSVVSAPSVANGDSRFNTFGDSGAYAFGAVNTSIENVTLQAWYYDVRTLATAIWAQADLNMGGILAGAQYTTLDQSTPGGLDGDAMAVMVGYEMKDVATFKVAYSTTSDIGAGQNVGGAQTKLYTELWWNYGKVATGETDTILVSAEATVGDIDLYAGYGMVDGDEATVALGGSTTDLNELTITATKSYGALDTTVAFINTDETVAGVNGGTLTPNGAENMLQVYLTYNF